MRFVIIAALTLAWATAASATPTHNSSGSPWSDTVIYESDFEDGSLSGWSGGAASISSTDRLFGAKALRWDDAPNVYHTVHYDLGVSYSEDMHFAFSVVALEGGVLSVNLNDGTDWATQGIAFQAITSGDVRVKHGDPWQNSAPFGEWKENRPFRVDIWLDWSERHYVIYLDNQYKGTFELADGVTSLDRITIGGAVSSAGTWLIDDMLLETVDYGSFDLTDAAASASTYGFSVAADMNPLWKVRLLYGKDGSSPWQYGREENRNTVAHGLEPGTSLPWRLEAENLVTGEAKVSPFGTVTLPPHYGAAYTEGFWDDAYVTLRGASISTVEAQPSGVLADHQVACDTSDGFCFSGIGVLGGTVWTGSEFVAYGRNYSEHPDTVAALTSSDGLTWSVDDAQLIQSSSGLNLSHVQAIDKSPETLLINSGLVEQWENNGGTWEKVNTVVSPRIAGLRDLRAHGSAHDESGPWDFLVAGQHFASTSHPRRVQLFASPDVDQNDWHIDTSALDLKEFSGKEWHGASITNIDGVYQLWAHQLDSSSGTLDVHLFTSRDLESWSYQGRSMARNGSYCDGKLYPSQNFISVGDTDRMLVACWDAGLWETTRHVVTAAVDWRHQGHRRVTFSGAAASIELAPLSRGAAGDVLANVDLASGARIRAVVDGVPGSWVSGPQDDTALDVGDVPSGDFSVVLEFSETSAGALAQSHLYAVTVE